jgi:predicted nuclease of predicted toxin-antitoxin system
MKFKIDENLPTDIAELLKKKGHDAITVPQQNLTGTSDENLASTCRKEKRTLVTLDTDFADIRAYPPEKSCGIIVMRLSRHDKSHTLEVFQRAIDLLSSESIEQHLWVVEADKIRIRP